MAAIRRRIVSAKGLGYPTTADSDKGALRGHSVIGGGALEDWPALADLTLLANGNGEADLTVSYVSHPFFGGVRRSGWQVDLVPNSALLALESLHSAALVIDASASLWGSPWAGMGNEIDPQRSVQLVDLIRSARRLDIPTLFRWDVPQQMAPAFLRISAQCDVVVRSSREIEGEDLPLVPHGLKQRAPNPGQERRIAVFDESDPFSSSIEPRLSTNRLDELAQWSFRRMPSGLIHKPHSLRQQLAGFAMAFFPTDSPLADPALEALDQGLVVVGPDIDGIPNLHSTSQLVIDDSSLSDIHDAAASSLLDTRWRIRERHSAAHEARQIGVLTAVKELREFESITGLVIAEGTSSLEECRPMLHEVEGLVNSLVVLRIEEGAPHTIGLAEHETVAESEADLVRIIRALPERSLLYMIQRSRDPKTARDELRAEILSDISGPDRFTGNLLVGVADLLKLDDYTMVETLVERRPTRTDS